MSTYPTVVATLREFGLITEEQALRAQEEFYAEMDDLEWWDRLAWIAWYNEKSFWSRLWSAGYPTWDWRKSWVEARRA